jgi:hypothetical protein
MDPLKKLSICNYLRPKNETFSLAGTGSSSGKASAPTPVAIVPVPFAKNLALFTTVIEVASRSPYMAVTQSAFVWNG